VFSKNTDEQAEHCTKNIQAALAQANAGYLFEAP